MVELKQATPNWSQLIESTRKGAEADAIKTADPVVLLEKAALVATAMLDKQVSAHDMAMMSMAMAIAKVSENHGRQDNYRDVITSAAYAGHLVGSPTKSLADLRVMSDLANVLAVGEVK